jgi:hypothetical protein
MFKKRTLFVVGAGASAEVNFPVGTQLARTIGKKLDIRIDRYDRGSTSGDLDIWADVQRNARSETGVLQKACWLIRDGVFLASSIDDFLDIHGQNEHVKRMGKVAIVKAILEAERASSLYFNRSNVNDKMPMAKVEGTWLVKFMRMLIRGTPLDKVETIFDNVAFIVFNYDRCIEHFLFHAIQQAYAIDGARASSVMAKLRIIHPYGAVAKMPYAAHDGIAFGGDADELQAPYWNLSNRIRTYTEQITDDGELSAIRDQVVRAERLVFLGFAFHDQNMRLLKPDQGLRRKEVIGTAFGMSDSDVFIVKSQLLTFFDSQERNIMDEGRILLENQHKCTTVFDYYTKSLPA